MSVNAVDQTTGNTTPLAGNTNNLVGNLSALTTSTKSDAVGAINELNQTKQNATDNNLQTTDKTVAGAINELKSGLTTVENTLDTKVTFTSVGGTNENYRDVTIPSDNNAVFLIVAGGSITSVSTDSAGNISDIVFVSISADSQKIDDHTVRIWGGAWYRSYSVLKFA